MTVQPDLFLNGDDGEIKMACYVLFRQGHTQEAWNFYRASRPYLELKRQRLLRAEFQCERRINGERCPATTELQLHHVTYIHRFFEGIDDVRIVCRSCHLERTGGDDFPMAAAAA
jgi:hypothetical protein